MDGLVVGVSQSGQHTFSKPAAISIRLIKGMGIDGDAHRGVTVQHRFAKRRNPGAPNLRQVHLIQIELHEELRQRGFDISPGQMGENITTRGIDLLRLPTGTLLHLGKSAIVELTGLRMPCVLLDRFRAGLKAATLDHDAEGNRIPKAGVMGVVHADGEVGPGDLIQIELPSGPPTPLSPV
jgi:MOSC domain-containing protein YiiM